MADSRTNTRLTPSFIPPDPNLLAIVRLYLERYDTLAEDDRQILRPILRAIANPPMFVDTSRLSEYDLDLIDKLVRKETDCSQ